MERGSDKDAFTKKTTLCERKVGSLCGERLTQASLGERVGPLGRDGQCPFDMLFVREMVRRWGVRPSLRGVELTQAGLGESLRGPFGEKEKPASYCYLEDIRCNFLLGRSEGRW